LEEKKNFLYKRSRLSHEHIMIAPVTPAIIRNEYAARKGRTSRRATAELALAVVEGLGEGLWLVAPVELVLEVDVEVDACDELELEAARLMGAALTSLEVEL